MNNEGMFGGSWLFAFLIIALLVGGNGGGLFGGGDVNAAVNAAVNNQSTQNGLRDVLLSSANNNYETLQSINGQTMAIMEQNNANLINAIQGFNAVNMNNANQFAELRQQIAGVNSNLEACCCSIQRQMLQDKYDGLLQQYTALQNDVSNSNQTQYLLSVMGKWVANPSGTTA